jgi:SAM-dependent methyltransferase
MMAMAMPMLGQATASLERAPRRWIQGLWGVPDIHARQKWAAVWPLLAGLPSTGLAVLDAGCGSGRWTLELAMRRPGWRLTGVDRDEAAIARARADAEALGVANAEFVAADFKDLHVGARSDVVISIGSAHYVGADEAGRTLFCTFGGWLKPDGLLCLLGPRSAMTTPFSRLLPRPDWHDVFSSDELRALCHSSQLEVRLLRGCIGRAGILAKQMAWVGTGRSAIVRALLYPAQYAIAAIDRPAAGDESRATLMWLLLARNVRTGTP